jgi:hydroxyacyl-ACP dehydratase HTD2-like protein with hotdog domain
MTAISRATELPAGQLPLPLPLPPLALQPSAGQVFMFSAVTWNRHHIHYSAEAARAEGHAGVVVQRALIGNFLARLLTGWLAGAGEIRSLRWKVVKSATPGQELRCGGEVVTHEERDGRRVLHCDLRVVDVDDHLLAEGTAELVLH